MPQSATPSLCFPVPAALPLEASFDGGRLTSDGGLPWLEQAEGRAGRVCHFCRADSGLAAGTRAPPAGNPDPPARLPDRLWLRGPGRCRHLAHRPAAQAGLRAAAGERAGLASQPTLSRLENAVDRQELLSPGVGLGRGVSARTGTGRPPYPHRPRYGWHRRSDARPAGRQRLSRLLPAAHAAPAARLRRGDAPTHHRRAATGQYPRQHGGHGRAEAGGPALRARWPEVTIEVRMDSGGAVPAIYDWCEAEGITYTIGLITNPRLTALAAPLVAEAQRQRAATGVEKVRLVGGDRVPRGKSGISRGGSSSRPKPAQRTQHPLRRHHPHGCARGALRLVCRPRGQRECHQGSEARLFR